MDAVSSKPRPNAAPEPEKGRAFAGARPLLEKLDLAAMALRCESEDGALRKALVHPPDHLFWTKESAINSVQKAHRPPVQEQVMREHRLLVEALASEGAEVVAMKPRNDLPEGVYQRDSICVIGDCAISARFRHPVRQRELAQFLGAYEPWKEGDIMEFGDVLVFPDAVLVGLGDRSNGGGAKSLGAAIGSRELITVPLKKGTLHLDYAMTIGGRGSMRTMVFCPDCFEDPSAPKAMMRRFGIRNAIAVPPERHLDGWTNLFFLSPESLISTTAAFIVNCRLREAGFRVIEVPFDGILRGEGAPRCCIAPLNRED